MALVCFSLALQRERRLRRSQSKRRCNLDSSIEIRQQHLLKPLPGEFQVIAIRFEEDHLPCRHQVVQAQISLVILRKKHVVNNARE